MHPRTFVGLEACVSPTAPKHTISAACPRAVCAQGSMVSQCRGMKPQGARPHTAEALPWAMLSRGQRGNAVGGSAWWEPRLLGRPGPPHPGPRPWLVHSGPPPLLCPCKMECCSWAQGPQLPHICEDRSKVSPRHGSSALEPSELGRGHVA